MRPSTRQSPSSWSLNVGLEPIGGERPSEKPLHLGQDQEVDQVEVRGEIVEESARGAVDEPHLRSDLLDTVQKRLENSGNKLV